jgi:hypothetical protein
MEGRVRALLCAMAAVELLRYKQHKLISRYWIHSCALGVCVESIFIPFQDIRGAGITGSGDRDWAPNPAFEFGVKSFDSKPQDGYHKFDLKRMARVGMEQGPRNQDFEMDQHIAKEQGQALQRRQLEQQIAENAARKEVLLNVAYC